MRALPGVFQGLRLPLIGAPLFIISRPALVIAQGQAGIVGALPALNARSAEELDEWLTEIAAALPGKSFAVNLIVHRSNQRLEADLALCAKHRVPLVITSLGAREDVNTAVKSWGGMVLHDVIDNRFAHKAVEKGADGLIAVAAGAGGHAGMKSPFALVQEIRQWFDGVLVLSGAMARGEAIVAAQVLGADLAYIGSAFIATTEAHAVAEYKQAVVDGSSDDIVYTTFFTGVAGNYLVASMRKAGLDPAALPTAAGAMNFGEGAAKTWRDIWGAGQGIGAVHAVVDTAVLIARFEAEYRSALEKLKGF